MSRSHDGHRSYSLFGNPFKKFFPRDSFQSPKLISLLKSFEETLAERFRKLKPKEGLEVLSLLWMRDAVESLSETHTDIKSFITDLEFPVSDWDVKWIDLYLETSAKLLDICNAISSKLSQIGQGQIFLNLGKTMDVQGELPSNKNLKLLRDSLHDWARQLNCSSPRFEKSSTILQELIASFRFEKIRNSSKGKILLRAMFGVRLLTVFVCTVLSTALSGPENLLLDFPVPDKFVWADAFEELQFCVNSEIKSSFPSGQNAMFKELKTVDDCVHKLLHLTSTPYHSKDGTEKSQECIFNLREQKSNCASVHKHEKQEPNDIDMVKAEVLQNSLLGLAEGSKRLAQGLELVSGQVENFFQIVLSGRDALLCNLRMEEMHSE